MIRVLHMVACENDFILFYGRGLTGKNVQCYEK